jgi:predicted phosphodiesterase
MDTGQRPIVFVWPGDLHLETDDRENYRVARWMVEEVNSLIRPDFVQFAGDNVQHATDAQFALFNGLRSALQVPAYPLVGDHDVHHDPKAAAYQRHVGPLYGSFTVSGVRFIRLDTMEYKPLGISPEQIVWFQYEVDSAMALGQRIVVFQHHYPFQIWEDFAGPGIDRWREIVTTRPITAVFAGHTHYGQVANDGHNIFIATRSIGDPEGGPAGYAVVYLDGEDLATVYRSIDDQGPVIMITKPRDVMLATDGRHIVSGRGVARVRTWSGTPIASVTGRIDGGAPSTFEAEGQDCWEAPLRGDELAKGEHELRVTATDRDGQSATAHIRFMVDRSGRYTAYPRVQPEVRETRFC